MINKTIGHIILKGGTTEELRKEFPNFPLNPTKQDFCNLGYKESTAKNYLFRLQSNNKQNVSANPNNISSQDMEEVANNKIIKSQNVDFNNLLVDTCALVHSETESLIERSKHVTFINVTLEEMDKKKKFKKDANESLKKLALEIQKYTNKILLDSEKYMLSTFSGLHDEKYPDNILLQYMLILPNQIRPTLLTADKNLAVKARMWNLQYILLDLAKESKKLQKEETEIINDHKLGLGMWMLISKDGTKYIENRGTFESVLINQEGSKTIKKRTKVESGDKICVYVKKNNTVGTKFFEIK